MTRYGRRIKTVNSWPSKKDAQLYAKVYNAEHRGARARVVKSDSKIHDYIGIIGQKRKPRRR